uniref:Peptidase S1 domain-containing protein n=1 Tax=Trichuris muris TaxID=70415 RepID=A0A5S6QWQ3_TRIMR
MMFIHILTIVAISLQAYSLALEPYDDGVCGRPKFEPKEKKTATLLRITGGHEATPHSHPWIVRIVYGNNACGGTILPTSAVNSSNVIATAAHCLRNVGDLENITVLAGAHDISKESENGRQVAKVADIKFSEEDRRYDFALLILKQPLQFTDYVKSACLPSNHYLKPRVKCLISGWGAVEGGVFAQTDPFHVPPVKLPERLMESVAVRHSDAFCEDESVVGNTYQNSIHICAGDAEGEKGVNNFDSGGPLICYDHGVWTLYGVIIRRSYRHESRPSVFMKVQYFTSMIRQHAKLEPW